MAEKKRYKMKIACPQCGCTQTSVMTAEEMQERYGDVPNIDLECGECMLKYTEEMKDACPDWDKDCKLQE